MRRPASGRLDTAHQSPIDSGSGEDPSTDEQTTFHVRQAGTAMWIVIDNRDETRFAGTMRECEDWLDRHENLRRQAAPRRPGGRRWIRRLFARPGNR